ncbi:MAG TPA: hypothetical protein VGX78_09695 [Pirellulales bacterium]|jgi:hypothetical protein|nr:hypothetical protein [Pirellulales bacterium]
MSRPTRPAVSFIGLFVVLLGGPARAQQLPAEYSASATVDEVGQDSLLVSDTKYGKVWVQLRQRDLRQLNSLPGTVEVTGTAETSFLKPGLLVRFHVKLEKGNVEGDVAALEIVTLSEKVQLGLNHEPVPGKTLKELEKAGPVDYIAVGRVKSFKNGLLQVSTGGDKDLKVKLSETAEVKVDVDDLSFASSGDTVEIKGRITQLPFNGGEVPGRVVADEMKVTLAKPLTGKKATAKKGKKSVEKKASDKKPKKKAKKSSNDDGIDL